MLAESYALATERPDVVLGAFSDVDNERRWSVLLGVVERSILHRGRLRV